MIPEDLFRTTNVADAAWLYWVELRSEIAVLLLSQGVPLSAIQSTHAAMQTQAIDLQLSSRTIT